MQSELNYTQEATKLKRAANYLIDSAIVFAFFLFLQSFVNSYYPQFSVYFDVQSEMYSATVICTALVYYIITEVSTGRTVGQRITKTMPITSKDEIPPYSTLLLRAVARFIPFNPISIFIFSKPWHDSVSATKVVEIA